MRFVHYVEGFNFASVGQKIYRIKGDEFKPKKTVPVSFEQSTARLNPYILAIDHVTAQNTKL